MSSRGGGNDGDEKWKTVWCNIGHVDSSATGSLGPILKQFLQDHILYIRGASRRHLGSVVRKSYDGRVSVCNAEYHFRLHSRLNIAMAPSVIFCPRLRDLPWCQQATELWRCPWAGEGQEGAFTAYAWRRRPTCRSRRLRRCTTVSYMAVKNDDDATMAIVDMKELLERGGFNLTKWITNSRRVLATIQRRSQDFCLGGPSGTFSVILRKPTTFSGGGG